MQLIFKKTNLSILLLFLMSIVCAQDNLNNIKSKQLNEELPDPNVYRNSSGALEYEYYQQKADNVEKNISITYLS